MQSRQLGRSGLAVSALGLGTNNFGMRIDAERSRKVVDAALDAGITHIDTADVYAGGRSEEILGEVLAGRRDEVVLATKFSAPTGEGPLRSGGSLRYVRLACEASLRRLRTDRIDVYYLHYPDPRTPIDETLGALDDLVHAGKVGYVATSNLPAWQMAEADHSARERDLARPVASQVEWSLLRREVEAEVVPAARHYGIGIVPYFPLASGLLTGKYARGEEFPAGTRLGDAPYFRSVATPEAFALVEELSRLSGQLDRSMVELALGWLLAQDPVSSVLVGATSAEQVEANASAVTKPLDPEEVGAIEALLDGGSGG